MNQPVEMDISAYLLGLLTQTLGEGRERVLLALIQRAKFEGWLKLELAYAVSRQPNCDGVTLEAQYPASASRADISFTLRGTQWFAEIKTANTNWRHPLVESKTRPITENVRGIIKDINKVRDATPSFGALAVFLLFPVPLRIWTRERYQLRSHLRRIEDRASLARGSVEASGSFMELQEGVGLTVYVVDVHGSTVVHTPPEPLAH